MTVLTHYRKTHRKTPIAIIATTLLMIAGVAFALYLLNASVSGNADTRTASYGWSQKNPVPSGSGSAAVCTASVPSNLAANNLTVDVQGYPGETCTINGVVTTIGAAEGFRVTGLALTGLPTGWASALTPATCGATAAVDTGTPVSFVITIGPSGSAPFTGAVTMSPVSEVGTGALTCTSP